MVISQRDCRELRANLVLLGAWLNPVLDFAHAARCRHGKARVHLGYDQCPLQSYSCVDRQHREHGLFHSF